MSFSRREFRARFLFLGLSTLVLAISFNNCAKYEAGTSGIKGSVNSASTGLSCSFGGYDLANGTSMVGYLTSTVSPGQSCVSEYRTCNDGVLSGSFPYTSCGTDSQAACLFNGMTIPSGTSVTGYSTSTVASGQSCSSVAETRTCFAGMLTGSAPYANCSVAADASCLFNGQTISSGASVTAYQSASVPAGQNCAGETRVCNNGTLSGSFGASSCTVQKRCGSFVQDQSLGVGAFASQFDVNRTTPDSCLSFCEAMNSRGICILRQAAQGPSVAGCFFFSLDPATTPSTPAQNISMAACY